MYSIAILVGSVKMTFLICLCKICKIALHERSCQEEPTSSGTQKAKYRFPPKVDCSYGDRISDTGSLTHKISRGITFTASAPLTLAQRAA